jgi:methionyl-tRNA synthetase
MLKDRVQQLEQANQIVGQRRRGKRTRLYKGGPITQEEASQVIDQMDVDMQVVAEFSRSGRRARSERPGGRHCSKCGKAGHNVRTCQEEIEVNMEEYSD